MAVKRPSGFKFTRLDTIGAPDAEMDGDILASCFVDTGDLAVIQDPGDRRVILLGRTGTGKTALLRRLELSHPDQTITIRPETLALSHIANSQILNSVSALGINLDPLFKLLWRHVFVVELLRRYFDQHAVANKEEGLLAWLQSFFSGTSREARQSQKAIEYLREWGESFWEETEYRVKEITRKIESEIEESLKASLGGKYTNVSGGKSTRGLLSDEERLEVANRTQEVVSRAQVQDLTQVMQLLGQVLSNRQHPYFIVIDQLDENWVEERVRYQLIKALILTAREFIGGTNAKIILAIRRDLIDRVFRLTRDPGFQEEKFVGNYLPLTWTRDQILNVLDSRVRYLVARRYTKQPVGYRDVLPETFDGRNIGDVIFEFAPRPRDVIALFNCCIQAGADKSYIGVHEFSIALGEYSRGRLRALADEWNADYPRLLDYAAIFKGRQVSFKIGSVTGNELEDLCLSIAAEHPARERGIHTMGHAVVEGDLSPSAFKEALFHHFYKTGLVGLKMSPDSRASWVNDSGQPVVRSQITDEVGVVLHPAYRRALGASEHRSQL
ncbi:MAG: hypothetical protein WD738_16965 [Pirellulales bacterium]